MSSVSQQQVPPAYQKTDFGIIPEDWDVATIGDKCNLLTGFPFPSSKYTESGVRLLRGSNVKRGVTDWSEGITQYWPALTADIRQYQLQEKDIVISMDGSLVGRSFAQLSKSDLPAILLQRVARLRSDDIEIAYLKEWVCSKFFTGHCDSVKTVTAIPHISPADIRSFKFTYPKQREEQASIAKALSDVDALTLSLEKLIAKKRAIKTAAMQQLLTGKKRLPPFDKAHTGYKQTELGRIPEDWEVNNFSDIAIPKSNRINPKVDGGGALCIELEHVNQGSGTINGSTLTTSESSLKSVFNVGDVLFGKLRSYLRKYWIADGNGVCSTEIWVLKANEHRSIPRFIFQLVQTDRFIDCTSESYGTHMPRSDWNVVKSFLVATPSIDEQSAMADILSEMDEEVVVLVQRLNKTQELKQGMMQELLTGRTRLV